LGYNLQQQGRIIEAIEYYQRAIELEPNHFWSYYYLAEAFATTKKNNLAIECYRQAIDLNPRALQIYFKLGQLLLNCPKAELETYQQSLIAKSDLIQAYFTIGLGQAWQAKQEFDRAIECYQQAIKIDPNLELPYKLLQYIPLTIERIDILIKFYREITESQPNIALAWGNLGDVLSEKYRIESAIDCYRKSCYYRTIDKNRNLADLNWDLPKIDAPDFIIIGAAKCGTTSLFEYLKHHPQILLPHKKEIDFFSNYFDRGKEWYLAHFPAISDRQEFITGEATTHYFDTYQVDRKIKQMFPKTKLIIILRNPIERTISDYYHHVNRGVEQRNLQEIIISTRSYLEAARETDLIYTPNEFDYILKSIYFPKIQRWMQQFARQQILILESELFFQDPKTTMREVFQFLELDFYLASEYNRYNIGSYSTIKTNLKQNLSEIFQTYNRQLQKFLNLNFSW
jgi:tetratricopeptide (TPR) repeat protein